MDKKIQNFYLGLDRGEKGRFLLWIQRKLEISQSTALLRVRNDDWKRIERELVEDAIESDTWRQG